MIEKKIFSYQPGDIEEINNMELWYNFESMNF